MFERSFRLLDRSPRCRHGDRLRCLTLSPSGLWKRWPLLTSALTLVFLQISALMAEWPEPPPYYAVRDVRVEIGDGRVLERATVLVEEGIITAVGPQVQIPPDARVLEGEGLTLFPGLMDALSSVGQKQQEESSGRPSSGGGFGGSRNEGAQGPEDRPNTTPWRLAAHNLDPEDGRIETWREAGFTAVASHPGDGFFAGQLALIQLDGQTPGQMVIDAPAAQVLSFERDKGRGYPGSLMGRIAYVRQVLYDARHLADLEQQPNGVPRGHDRPEYDRSLRPLIDAFAQRSLFLLPADSGSEIDRMQGMAEEHGLRSVLYGAQGAWARVEELASTDNALLLSLDWPEANSDRDPDADTALRTLIHRRFAPATAGRLQRAGVPFAFYSGELSSPDKVFAGLRRAIDSGLEHGAALEAMTLGVARIYGVDDRLGSVEVGKIANLVLATDAPWAKGTEIRALFVDGRLHAMPAEDEEDQEPPVRDISGTWALSMESSRGSREMSADLDMSPEGKVSGEITSERGAQSIQKGRLSGDRLTLETSISMGSRSFTANYELTVADKSLSGSVAMGPRRMEISGEQTSEAKAEAAEDGDGEDEEAVSDEELERALAIVQGPVAGRADDGGSSFAIVNAKVYTVSGQTLERGSVLVADGKIEAVGEDLRIPSGIEVIDAEGGALIPGIVDAHSHIAVDGSVNEGSLAVTSMVSVDEVIDPDDIAIYRALAGGVTTINVLHGSANPIGGGNAMLKLRWGQDAAGLRFAGAPPGIKFALGENPKRSRSARPGTQQRYPATRMGVMDVIRQAFLEAKEYQQEWQRWEQRAARSHHLPEPRRDLRLHPLMEVLEGKRLVHAHCYRADEIVQLLRLAEEFGFRIATLQHVLEGYKIADEIAAHGAGASTFSDWWGFKVEAYDAIAHNAALMAERGVVVSINSDSGEEMRHLNQEAGKSLRWGGMEPVAALAMVTLNPAKQLGIADRVGSIEPGKDADLVLYDRDDPLSIYSVVQKTFVDGQLYFDRQADRERQALIEDLKERLEGKDEEGGPGGGKSEPGQGPASDPEGFHDLLHGDEHAALDGNLSGSRHPAVWSRHHPPLHNQPASLEPGHSQQETR